MKLEKLIITSLILLIECGSKSQPSDGCSEFEFKNLNVDTNKWKEENVLKEIDYSVFKEHISKFKEFKYVDPKSLFRVCEISIGSLNGFVIAELNGPRWDMYFIPESSGKIFMLACNEASPDDYRMIKSKLVNDNLLEMKTIYIFSEGKMNYQDSIISQYKIINENEFVKIKSDSTRTDFK